MLVILSGSSGVGKNTVINKILEENSNIELCHHDHKGNERW